MRPRMTLLAAGIAVALPAATPTVAGAAPQRDRGLTIRAVPRTIIAGESVLIYGRLYGPARAGRTIRLYHRIAPRGFFSLVAKSRTDAGGRYEFPRAAGVVMSSRAWFVRGPDLTHSRTVLERVQALVSLQASSDQGVTHHPLVFSGHVTPDHTGQRVLLQAQKGSSDDWHTLEAGRLGRGSNYELSYGWRMPGVREVRVAFPGDRRNTAGASDPVALAIQQAQVPDFTISTSEPLVGDDQPARISGVLYMPGSTSTPDPGVTVQLFARLETGGSSSEVQRTVTGLDGSYAFTVQSTSNRWYQVRTALPSGRHSAQMFEGVQDAVTLNASATSSRVGQRIGFTGTVSPDKAGHVIYLQKLGADHDWHTIEVRAVRMNSTFAFDWMLASSGVKQFRVRITGGPANVGGASSPVTVDVAPAAASNLPGNS